MRGLLLLFLLSSCAGDGHDAGTDATPSLQQFAAPGEFSFEGVLITVPSFHPGLGANAAWRTEIVVSTTQPSTSLVCIAHFSTESDPAFFVQNGYDQLRTASDFMTLDQPFEIANNAPLRFSVGFTPQPFPGPGAELILLHDESLFSLQFTDPVEAPILIGAGRSSTQTTGRFPMESHEFR